MNEEEKVLLAWKIYRETKINRAWLLALLDSIINNTFEQTLKKASKIFYIPKAFLDLK